MTSRDFCYWLQGFFELSHCVNREPAGLCLSPEQVSAIREHLQLVFRAETESARTIQATATPLRPLVSWGQSPWQAASISELNNYPQGSC